MSEMMAPAIGSVWLHKKSGHYYSVVDIVVIEATVEDAVSYRRIPTSADQRKWVRSVREFMDGRFEPGEYTVGR